MNPRPPLFFCGSSHRQLGEEICALLGLEPGKVSLGRFPDGETSVEVLDDVWGRDTFVLQTTALDPNNYLIELLILIDALKRASANTITAIIPYFGYCRQDRKTTQGEPITARLIANLLTSAGATRLITLDLHAGQLEGFFEIPVDHLHASSLLAAAVTGMDKSNGLVVAPDIGSVKIAKKVARQLEMDFVVIEKQRLSPTAVNGRLIGSVEGKTVLIVDDIFSTGKTVASAGDICRAGGAQRILATVTHPLCSEEALQLIETSPIERLITTNTIPPQGRYVHSKKIQICSVAPLIAASIKHRFL